MPLAKRTKYQLVISTDCGSGQKIKVVISDDDGENDDGDQTMKLMIMRFAPATLLHPPSSFKNVPLNPSVC